MRFLPTQHAAECGAGGHGVEDGAELFHVLVQQLQPVIGFIGVHDDNIITAPAPIRSRRPAQDYMNLTNAIASSFGVSVDNQLRARSPSMIRT